MNRTRAQQLRNEMDALMDALREKGLAVKFDRTRFTNTYVTFQVTDVEERADGLLMTREAMAFKVIANSKGMSPEWLGKSFQFQGEKFRIIGYKTRGKKYPMLCERVEDSKLFKFSVASVISYMNSPVHARD